VQCPQRAARSGNFGAYLLDTDQHQLVVDILATARSSQLGVPTCAKIRLLPTLDETIHFCTLLLPHIDVLTIHGRTRGFVEERRRGPADLQQVKQVFAALRKHMAARPPAEQRSVLLWTNGNVRCDGDVALQLASTGADGCMVGEAVLNDPTMFEQRASTHPELLTFAPDTLLDVREFDRKMAIAEEYIQQLRTPKYAYRSPFDLQPSGASTDASNAASASAAAPTSCVDDSSFRTPLVDWSSFHAHLYRLFNADCRARFLYHAQLVDEFLDAGSIGEVRTILQSVRDRLAAGRPFDVALQSEIDGQRSHRQGARAAEERRRASALTGEKVINSRERKRARWQQRNHEKRRKLEDGRPAAGVEEVLRAAAAATATASEPD
jgi:hypothetical protein